MPAPNKKDLAALRPLSRRQRQALIDVLVACTAAAGSDDVDRSRLSGAVDEAPISALPAAARLHAVSGSVLRGLALVDNVPESVLSELTAARDEARLRHLLAVGAMGTVAEALDGAGLRWLVMKGPVLSALYYSGTGDRIYADLDLLVDRRDFPVAVELLEGLGFENVIKNWALAAEVMAGQIELISPLAAIDLHWHLHYSNDDRRPYAFDPESMIERATRRRVSGVDVPVLESSDRVMALAFHAARSGGYRLVWLKDLERVLRVDRPDMAVVVARSTAAGCGHAVGIMLDRARRLQGAPVDEKVICQLVPRHVIAAERLAAKLASPVQLGQRPVASQVLVRSLRSSTLAAAGDIPARIVRRLRTSVIGRRENETDDPAEKAAYLRAVAAPSPVQHA